MKVNKAALLLRLEKLKQIVSKPPKDVHELPEQVQHIIKTAPQALSDLEIALEGESQQDLLAIQEVVNQLERFIQWAVGLSAGKSMAEAVQSGAPPDLAAPAQKD